MATTETARIVAREQWLSERKVLLQAEKALTRQRDALSAQRRALPWVLVDKTYRFEAQEGSRTLADLFGDHRQLVVKHFMFAPEWEEGCVGCSFEVDHLDAARVHLENHDVSLVAVSRAPLAKINAFKARMGWAINWVSSLDSDFNYDYHVSFTPEASARGRVHYNFAEQDFMCEELSGISVFYRDGEGRIFHTYSAYGRGAEEILATYMVLDLTPLGRNENGPGFNLTDWVRHHDRYGDTGHVDASGRYVAGPDCCHEAV